MYADPYEYPTEDAKLWLELLVKVCEKDRYLFGILVHIRAVGAVLVSTGNPNMPYKIEPIIDQDRGWSSQAEYNEERKYLIPYATVLTEILKTL